MFRKAVIALAAIAALAASAIAQNDQPGRYERAMELINQEQHAEGIELLAEIVEAAPTAEEVMQARRTMINAMIESGAIIRAERVCREFIEAHPTAPDIHDMRAKLARICEAQGNYRDATVAWREYLEQAPDGEERRDAHIHLAEMLNLVTRQREAAIDEFRAVAELYPGEKIERDALLRVAQILDHGLNRHSDAVEHYDAWVEQFPRDERAPEILQRAAHLRGWRVSTNARDYAAQALTLEKFIELYPDHPDIAQIYFDLGYVYNRYLNQHQKASEAWRKAVERNPNESWRWYLVQAERQLPERDERIESLRRFIAEYPESSNLREAQRQLSNELRDAEKGGEQVVLLRGMIESYPGDCQWEMWELGLALQRAEKYGEAFDAFASMIEKFPQHQFPGSYQRMVAVAAEAERMADALRVARAGYENSPDPELLHIIAHDILFQRMEDHAESIRLSREMLEKYPNHPRSGRQHAIERIIACHRATDNLDGAIAILRQFHQSNPGNEPNPRYARAAVAQLLLEQEKYPEALTEAEIVLDPTIDDEAHNWALLMTGRAHVALENYDEAIDVYIDLWFTRAEPRMSFMHGAIDNDRRNLISPLIGQLAGEEAIENDELGRALFLRGKLYHAAGDNTRAVNDYDAYRLIDGAEHDDRARKLREEIIRAVQYGRFYNEGPYEDLKIRTLIRRADEFHSRRQAAQAEQIYKLIAEKSEAHKDWALAQIPAAWENAQQWERAVKAYIEWYEENPDAGFQYPRKIASLWINRWSNAGALAKVREIITESVERGAPKENHYWAFRMLAAPDPKQMEEALKYLDSYEQLAREENDEGAIYEAANQRRNILRNDREYEKLGEYCETWVRRHPGHPNAGTVWWWAVEGYRDARTYDRIAAMEDINDNFVNHGNYLSAASYIGYNGGNYSLAAKMYANHMESNRDAEYYYYECLWRAEQQRDEVRAAWLRIFEERPADWHGYRSANNLINYHQSRRNALEQEARELEGEEREAKLAEAAEHLGRIISLSAGMVENSPPGAGEVRQAAERLVNHYMSEGTYDAALAEKYASSQFDRRGESLYTLWFASHVADIMRERGDYLDADILMAREIVFTHQTHNHSYSLGLNAAVNLNEAGRYEEAAALVKHLNETHRSGHPNDRARANSLLTQSLMASGGGIDVIDDSLPWADLLRGDMLCSMGEEDLAYARFRANREIFQEHRARLSPEYIRLIAERELATRDTEDIIDMVRGYLIAVSDSPDVPDEGRALLQNFIGECYQRTRQYDLARHEYQTTINLYSETAPANEARFRIAESFLTQGIFDRADEQLAELLESEDRDVIVRATLMRGVVLHAQGRHDESMTQFQTALDMEPPQRIADELFYRLGEVYHEQGKLREAYNLYSLVGSGGRDTKRLLEPGTALRFRLSDRDLNITRGEARVPIVVWADSGDREIVRLTPSEAGGGIFIGDIMSRLGEPNPGDNTLQVKGESIVYYAYEEQFARDFVLTEDAREPREIAVASDGLLKVSAMRFEEDDDEPEEPISLFMVRDDETVRRDFRNQHQAKPGNPIYIQVKDPDMSLTGQRDRVSVNIIAASGDSVKKELVETEPHSGLFAGSLSTALRPPDASASDSASGRSPLFAIDGDKRADRSWMAQRDNRAPKWLTMDMKELRDIDKISWHRGEGADDRAVLRYVIETSRGDGVWTPVAWAPDSENRTPPTVGIAWESNTHGSHVAERSLSRDGNLGHSWLGSPNADEWIIDYDIGGVVELERTLLHPQDQNNGVARYEIYVEEERGLYPGRSDSMEGWRMVYESPEIDPAAVDVAEFDEDIEARYVRVRVMEKIGHYPRIGWFEIYPRGEFSVMPAEEGIGATIEFPAQRCRFIRLHIFEYSGDAPAVADFRAWEGGDVVVPSGIDVHALAENDTLEMSPGDRVTVSYVDEVNMRGSAPRTLRDANLQATFYNAGVEVIRRFFFDDDAGRRIELEHAVRRANPGDRIIVKITDYDEDKTDDIDTIPFVVRTSGGREMQLTASETDGFTGVFTKEVDITDREEAGKLQVRPGETITIGYIDDENTDPGHAVERTATVSANSPTIGRTRILSTVSRGDDDQRTGAPALLDITQPLTVEVTDPDMALHMGSTVNVTLRTSSGVEAKVECEIAGSEDLAAGTFTGTIPMTLGDRNSPPHIVLEVGSLRTRRGRRQDALVPVLNVMGGDTITAVYVDDRVPAVSAPAPGEPKPERKHTARLASDGEIGFFDEQYENEIEEIFMGDIIYLKAEDPVRDVSEEPDSVTVRMTSDTGDRFDVTLRETTRHSGEFTGSVEIHHSAQPDPDNDMFECDFGAEITVAYMDENNTTSTDAVERSRTANVVIGSDGAVVAFERKYPDEEIAVETQLRMGESFYELGRQHMQLAESEKDEQYKEELEDLARRELAQGEEILRTLLRNYPDSEMIPDVAYLLARLAEEQRKYEEALEAYERIVRSWPESLRAIEAQYRRGICFEKLGDFDRATEAYVELAYRHPDNSLVGDAMIRIGLYFFEEKDFVNAANVFARFVEKYPDHAAAEETAFQWGLSLLMAENFPEAGERLEQFTVDYPHSELRPSAFYWAGDAFLKGRNTEKAYQMFTRVVWDYPESDWARWSRGRLTAPVFERMQ